VKGKSKIKPIKGVFNVARIRGGVLKPFGRRGEEKSSATDLQPDSETKGPYKASWVFLSSTTQTKGILTGTAYARGQGGRRGGLKEAAGEEGGSHRNSERKGQANKPLNLTINMLLRVNGN